MRSILLAAVVLVAIVAIATVARHASDGELPRATWIATAQQLGPVGYRDPAGAISPDGRWIAYSEGRFLRVRPVSGGPIVDWPAGEAQIRNIAWNPDSRTIVADGYRTQAGWAVYDRVAATRQQLWAGRESLTARLESANATRTVRPEDLRQLAWSPDGRSIAGIVNGRDGQELWIVSASGDSARATRMSHGVAFPAWTRGGQVACIETMDGRARVAVPCGGSIVRTEPDADAYGPIAFAPDDRAVYVALANAAGMVDLYAAPTRGGPARRLTAFARDAYAPTVATDGAVVFKTQSYRTIVAVAPETGGQSRALATFQSETPSWHPDGHTIGITYGSWRRVIDDAHYPDIAQDAGIIGADASQPAGAPSSIVHASASEDQSLCWSPNGRWIAFHSHKDQSDDIWLRDAAGSAPPRRVSFLGRGAETGWPRWSPDGRWLLFDGASRTSHRSVAYIVGADQESGATVGEAREVTFNGLDAEVSHAEWLSDSATLAVIGKEAPGRHVIFTVPRDGGPARVVHRFASEHDAPGLAVRPDGRDVAFIAPAADGFFQVFRMPIQGGEPMAVTTDPTNKTQPAWSPDGQRIAFTVWNYSVQFWRIP